MERTEHHRISYSVLNLISEMSGLIIGLLGIIGSISSDITYNHTASRLIIMLYKEKQLRHNTYAPVRISSHFEG